MSPIYLLDIAAQQAKWASARQVTITGNIANASTSGYTAMDVAPFSAALDDASFALATTAPGHIGDDGATGGGAAVAVGDSGAPVSLDNELVKADETNRTFGLDASIMRAFQQMLMSAVRSSP